MASATPGTRPARPWKGWEVEVNLPREPELGFKRDEEESGGGRDKPRTCDRRIYGIGLRGFPAVLVSLAHVLTLAGYQPTW